MDSEGWEAELARGTLLARGQAGRQAEKAVGGEREGPLFGCGMSPASQTWRPGSRILGCLPAWVPK